MTITRRKIKMEQNLYYNASDVAKILGVSRGKSYKILRELNEELRQKGYIVIAGRIPKKFFNEHYYGLT